MKRYSTFVIFLIVFGLCGGIAFAERLAVSSPVANIRSGPGTTFDIIWKIGKYHPIVVLEKKGSWYRFRDFEEDEGWIHKTLVSDIPTVITVKDKCNIRSGPGNKFKILFVSEKGIPFKVVKRKGNWIHIKHADGDAGWIYKSLVWYEGLGEQAREH